MHTDIVSRCKSMACISILFVIRYVVLYDQIVKAQSRTSVSHSDMDLT
jgi:hypothetical protein